MLNLSALGLVFSWLAFIGAHPFYLSLTDMQYNAANQEIEIAIKIFTDDLDETLTARYGEAIRLETEREHPDADAYLFTYIEENFSLSIQDQALPLSYLGREVEEDVVWVYLTVPCASSPEQVKVKQAILLDMFEGQRNIVHLEVNGNIESLLLQKGKPSGLLAF